MCVCVNCYIAVIDDFWHSETGQAGVPADHHKLHEFMAELPGQLQMWWGDCEFSGQLRAQWWAVLEPGHLCQQQLCLQSQTTGPTLWGCHFVIVKHHACHRSQCVPHTLVRPIVQGGGGMDNGVVLSHLSLSPPPPNWLTHPAFLGIYSVCECRRGDPCGRAGIDWAVGTDAGAVLYQPEWQPIQWLEVQLWWAWDRRGTETSECVVVYGSFDQGSEYMALGSHIVVHVPLCRCCWYNSPL